MDVIKTISPSPDAGPYALATTDVSAVKRKYLDIAYANASQNQKMDIYLPDDGEGPFPVIMFIHGGAFWGGERRDCQFLFVINGIRRGYAVVSVDYRLSDEAKYPAAIHDVKAALRHLRANAAQYLIDTERVAVVGASAGAYLAAMLGTTAGVDEFADASMGNAGIDCSVQAVIGMFGVYDPVMQSHFTENAVAPKLPNFMDIFMGFNCRENPQLAMRAWPGNYVTEKCPPMLIQAGSADEIVPYPNSIEFANKINAVCGGNRAIFETFPNCKHGDPAFSTSEAEERRFQFLDEHMK